MIHFQIEDYLKKKLIYMYQPGFRADQSLDFCLSLSHWTTFDILDHKIHFEKAKYSSFQASLIKRFESCLSINMFGLYWKYLHEAGTLKHGVPQGFILALLLALL